jgi:hypothetical protein
MLAKMMALFRLGESPGNEWNLLCQKWSDEIGKLDGHARIVREPRDFVGMADNMISGRASGQARSLHQAVW